MGERVVGQLAELALAVVGERKQRGCTHVPLQPLAVLAQPGTRSY